MRTSALWRTAAFSLGAAALFAGSEDSYTRSIEQWRAAREASLKSDTGWLTVAGLFWLKEGANSVGTAPGSSVLIPRGPAQAGVFEKHGNEVTFHPAAGVSVAGATATPLKNDAADKPDVLTIGDCSMYVIHRGERNGIRLKDPQSSYRRDFTQLHWYPVKPDYRVEAKFVTYPSPKMLSIPNILGETEKQESAGYAEFTLNGKTYRLDPVREDQQLFYIFRDTTSGKGTYGAGRFLYSDLPKDGKVLLDFNKAYNPPCAFTPFATCPLPPPENRLKGAIEAGELKYGNH